MSKKFTNPSSEVAKNSVVHYHQSADPYLHRVLVNGDGHDIVASIRLHIGRVQGALLFDGHVHVVAEVGNELPRSHHPEVGTADDDARVLVIVDGDRLVDELGEGLGVANRLNLYRVMS